MPDVPASGGDRLRQLAAGLFEPGTFGGPTAEGIVAHHGISRINAVGQREWLTTVRTDQVIPTQANLDPMRVMAIRHAPGNVPTPTGTVRDGALFQNDGHHRTEASRMSGNEEMEMWLAELGPDGLSKAFAAISSDLEKARTKHTLGDGGPHDVAHHEEEFNQRYRESTGTDHPEGFAAVFQKHKHGKLGAHEMTNSNDPNHPHHDVHIYRRVVAENTSLKRTGGRTRNINQGTELEPGDSFDERSRHEQGRMKHGSVQPVASVTDTHVVRAVGQPGKPHAEKKLIVTARAGSSHSPLNEPVPLHDSDVRQDLSAPGVAPAAHPRPTRKDAPNMGSGTRALNPESWSRPDVVSRKDAGMTPEESHHHRLKVHEMGNAMLGVLQKHPKLQGSQHEGTRMELAGHVHRALGAMDAGDHISAHQHLRNFAQGFGRAAGVGTGRLRSELDGAFPKVAKAVDRREARAARKASGPAKPPMKKAFTFRQSDGSLIKAVAVHARQLDDLALEDDAVEGVLEKAGFWRAVGQGVREGYMAHHGVLNQVRDKRTGHTPLEAAAAAARAQAAAKVEATGSKVGEAAGKVAGGAVVAAHLAPVIGSAAVGAVGGALADGKARLAGAVAPLKEKAGAVAQAMGDRAALAGLQAKTAVGAVKGGVAKLADRAILGAPGDPQPVVSQGARDAASDPLKNPMTEQLHNFARSAYMAVQNHPKLQGTDRAAQRGMLGQHAVNAVKAAKMGDHAQAVQHLQTFQREFAGATGQSGAAPAAKLKAAFPTLAKSSVGHMEDTLLKEHAPSMDALEEEAGPETVHHAAITHEGEVYTGQSHGHAARAAAAAGVPKGRLSQLLLFEPQKQGFMTSKNRFVDRSTAYQLARNAGQLKQGHDVPDGELESGDHQWEGMAKSLVSKLGDLSAKLEAQRELEAFLAWAETED